jgi:hypothetical protein
MRRRFLLLLEDIPPVTREGMSPPTAWNIRLRHLLKHLRRAYAFKCLSVKELVADDPPGAGHSDGSGGPGMK